MQGHILFCGVHFDATPQGINTGRLVRALLQRGNRITMVCGTEKSRLGFEHERLRVIPLSVQPRHPRWLWRAVAAVRGHWACNHYLWTRRAASLVLPEMPDVVYGRAWPYSSLVGAASLARAIGRPLWLHFSDPFPPPPKTTERAHLMRDLAEMAQQAAGATFTNAQQRDYQLRFLPMLAPEWGQVLNHIAPPVQRLAASDTVRRLVYIGSFSSARPPDALFAGFAHYLRTQPQARLHCVGSRADKVNPAIRRLGLEGKILVEPFTREIAAWQTRASVLLAVDWLKGEPVYLLTKTVESLVVNRPLFLLTQAGSPGARLTAQFPDTTVCVTSTDPADIARGLDRAMQMADGDLDYASRFAAMQAFTADAVAARCEALLLGSRR